MSLFWPLIHRGIQFAQGRPQPASPLGVGPDGLARSFVDPPPLPSPATGRPYSLLSARSALTTDRDPVASAGPQRKLPCRPGWGPSQPRIGLEFVGISCRLLS